MDEINKKDKVFIDPALEAVEGYSTETESKPQEYPKNFAGIHNRIIKCVSLYLQLLWNADPNGKTIKVFNVSDILRNVKNLFGGRYNTIDIYIIRHIASDLRELNLFNGFQIEKYFKNIEINRPDIRERLALSEIISKYFSAIIHFNYVDGDNSYEIVKKINEKLDKLKIKNLEIPDNYEDYLKKVNFESIFEQISIIFIMNYYEIFSEFLFDSES